MKFHKTAQKTVWGTTRRRITKVQKAVRPRRQLQPVSKTICYSSASDPERRSLGPLSIWNNGLASAQKERARVPMVPESCSVQQRAAARSSAQQRAARSAQQAGQQRTAAARTAARCCALLRAPARCCARQCAASAQRAVAWRRSARCCPACCALLRADAQPTARCTLLPQQFCWGVRLQRSSTQQCAAADNGSATHRCAMLRAAARCFTLLRAAAVFVRFAHSIK